jgi:hypothetical protein
MFSGGAEFDSAQTIVDDVLNIIGSASQTEVIQTSITQSSKWHFQTIFIETEHFQINLESRMRQSPPYWMKGYLNNDEDYFHIQ